ncbi:hypothetical protein RHGRI_010979 [Rhododendron griersonianum]|uniref:Uncharacterized protein n=1 Tax=Rhododendron griersonianum TaxID=479676 RepID=A0AAV6KKW0_9ERIC|nr:hypothetical protein RHGRI_010979 [Rhododendron griersonianum]
MSNRGSSLALMPRRLAAETAFEVLGLKAPYPDGDAVGTAFRSMDSDWESVEIFIFLFSTSVRCTSITPNRPNRHCFSSCQILLFSLYIIKIPHFFLPISSLTLTYFNFPTPKKNPQIQKP